MIYICVYIHTFIPTNTYHRDIWNSDTLELLCFHVLTSEDQNWCWILTFSTTYLLSLLRFVSSGTRWTSRVVSFRGLRFEQTCCSSFHLREMEKNSRVESQIYLLHSDMDFWLFLDVLSFILPVFEFPMCSIWWSHYNGQPHLRWHHQ